MCDLKALLLLQDGKAPSLFKEGCMFVANFNSNDPKNDPGAFVSSRNFESAGMAATRHLPLCKDAGAITCNGKSGGGRNPNNPLSCGGVAITIGLQVEQIPAGTPRLPSSCGQRTRFYKDSA